MTYPRIDPDLPIEWDDGTPSFVIRGYDDQAFFVDPHPEYIRVSRVVEVGIWYNNKWNPSHNGHTGAHPNMPKLRNVLTPKPSLSHLGLID